MNTLFKFSIQKLICFFVFSLCSLGIGLELKANEASALQNIEVEQKIDQLLLLIQKRLVIMHEVARTKWNQNLSIEDKGREQHILTELAGKANQYGLDEKWVTCFFQAQMDASKEIQKNDFTLWQNEGVLRFDEVFSLKDELRSYIDHLNQAIILLLSEIYKKGLNVNSKSILDHPISIRNSDYIEDDIWLLATFPLKTNQ